MHDCLPDSLSLMVRINCNVDDLIEEAIADHSTNSNHIASMSNYHTGNSFR